MPKPPILPTLDWPAIFKSGQQYDAWLAAAESEKHRDMMKAIYENVSIDADTAAFVQSIKRPVHIVAIAEDWCGDVVRHAPVLHKIAELSDNVRVRFIAREDHPDVFARFLTVGGEAIPKFIFLSDQFVECGHWGPMPADCRELIARGKACGDLKTARERVMEHYQDDPTCTQVVKELRELLEIAACDAP